MEIKYNNLILNYLYINKINILNNEVLISKFLSDLISLYTNICYIQIPNEIGMGNNGGSSPSCHDN